MVTPRPPRRPIDPERRGNLQAVRGAAYALLARRDFTTGELRERLAAKGWDPDAVARAVAELLEERMLDDARYASNYVAYHAARGRGPIRIGAELRARIVPAELIEAALASVPDGWARARPRLPQPGPKKAAKRAFCSIGAFHRIISAPPSAPTSIWTSNP
jgi:SOS response regulatory protein OraA/RecX